MPERYLLYIDILGFEDLVRKDPEKVDDLYQIIASLGAHSHWGFSVVGFSDTILVHNTFVPSTAHEHAYVIMYCCEFAQELLYRLAGRKLFFRAVLTYGKFEHYLLNEQHYYYGPALIDCYRAEKEFKVTGLLMDDKCARDRQVFSVRQYAPNWNYVFLTRGLDTYEDEWLGMCPLEMIVLADTGLASLIGPELETLHNSLLLARNHPDEHIRLKYKNTLTQYRIRYPKVFAALEPHDLLMEQVNTAFDWSTIRAQLNESYAFASIRTDPRPGTTGRARPAEGEQDSNS